MGFKVLEVNASATCNGRQVLANLGGTSQIHNVRGYLMLCPRRGDGVFSCIKGQTISKANYSVLDSPKKRTKLTSLSIFFTQNKAKLL